MPLEITVRGFGGEQPKESGSMNPVGGIVQGAVSAVQGARGVLEERRFERRSREFAREAYQRTVADLQAAGLNPMLAYMGSGPSSAQKGSARGGVDGSIGSAITGAQLAKAQIENMRQQNRVLSAEADKADVEKTIYRGLLPLADWLEKTLGNWSADSAKRGADVSPGGVLDAARGKTTDLFEWVGERLQGLKSWGKKETWLDKLGEQERSK